LEAVQPFAVQDAIESATVHYQTVSDEVYWLYGLAMGLVAASRCAER
jgi:hypothetical protein